MKLTLTLITSLSLLISSQLQANIKNGLWLYNCHLGLSKAQSFSDNRVISLENFYKDQNCQNISFQFTTTGQIETHSENSQFIDFSYDEVYLSLSHQLLIDDFNSRQVCGYSNWKLNEEKKITGLKCALFNYNKESQIPFKNQKKFGIYKVINNSLFYGQLTKDLDGSTELKRPQTFNELIEYIFQN